MITIYKYGLSPAPFSEQVVALPQGAKVLTAQLQDGAIFLWAIIDTSKPKEDRWFTFRGTGHDLPTDHGTYISTVQIMGGLFVLHLFETTKT